MGAHGAGRAEGPPHQRLRLPAEPRVPEGLAPPVGPRSPRPRRRRRDAPAGAAHRDARAGGVGTPYGLKYPPSVIGSRIPTPWFSTFPPAATRTVVGVRDTL